MCGITGFTFGRTLDAESARPLLGRMLESIRHRGPDDGGEWYDDRVGIALGHRRLSILDLSPAGHQPMVSAANRFVVIFNGEIYNHLKLRNDLGLAGDVAPWRGHSDTETLLRGFDRWGVEDTLARAIGMFAFVAWDRERRVLLMARDRFGEKPLYLADLPGGYAFGSDLRSIRLHPAFDHAIDRAAVTSFLRHGYVPGPRSIYAGARKLSPGVLYTVDPADHTVKEHVYWSMIEVAREGREHPFQGGPDEAVDELDRLLGVAVERQMISDVPLGAFLSGGIDSSTIVALMQARSSRPIRTFSIGFREDGFDEATYARAVARHLGTDHTELYVSAQDAMDVIPRIPVLYSEPFADPSQIPTYLVSDLARRSVTVSLSGDAGDELFGGYTRYTFTLGLWARIGMLPKMARKGLAIGMESIRPQSWDATFRAIEWAMPRKIRQQLRGDRVHKLAHVFRTADSGAFYRQIVSHWKAPASVVRGGLDEAPPSWSPEVAASVPRLAERMMLTDLLSYLPDDILVKVDRAAMGVSLETRVPLLDRCVVEFAARLPVGYKIRDGETKWVLRRVLDRYLPRRLFDRPKMGFGVPIDAWLRGPLRAWAEDLLDRGRLEREGIFEPGPIRALWSRHLEGVDNGQYPLWNVLMFQAWHGAQDG